ncbi:MAG: YegS/Rv2252/BmrU family lipid kinase [Lachnospiraceae bacterium]|nr:YegS/Rv2252/BmrU family lipid kinase [Lachnospiraceae bacterium]MBQ1608529.1 YegS/Rv2252/BmrU family lipid kinase [Lachnospiraceae bacterium]MBQ1639846.1 YegS/Rv2252/BmrU family lipid kinase [Lachnospiraceae bacterium]MBQ2317791.1 YegS/Rv2252/BmrU family lipid kinase [Lachnospiraceae bacterium]MBQ2466623.1 YegS/Rv2252/BmrU family lipid kinase [Lachnospiraceae bacterium]
MGKKLLFIYNPHSGKGLIRNYLADIVDTMVKAGFEVTIYPTQAPADATRKVQEEASRYDRIVCSGGDGTLDEVVTGMMSLQQRVPIGYIPAGSTNDFGNSLGIDKDMRRAAEIAVNGRPYPVDIGRFNKDNFVYVAAFGIFTEVSYATSQDLKNALGHVAYLLEAVKQLADIPSFRMQVEYDGNMLYDEFIYGMITNTKSVGGMKGIIPGAIDLQDGVFEVTLIRTPKTPIDLTDIVNFLLGNSKESEFVYSFQTGELKFTAAEQVPWTLDGEFGGAHEVVNVKNMHEAVEIMVE